MRWIYNGLFTLWVILISPRLFQKKYRGSLLYRLGLKTPAFPEKKEKRIWVHAVSLGETKAVGTLIEKIKQEWPHAKIFFSSVTETGQREARKHKSIDFCFFLPLDFSFLMRKTVRLISPDLFILVETDFWCNLLTELKRIGVKIALVNGKISDSSYRKFQKLSLFKKIFTSIDLFCVQDDEYKKRFLGLGVPKNKVVVTGNLKFDIPRLLKANDRIHLPKAKRCITISCTHENEEEMILDTLKDVSDVCLLLAPRHPERFPKVGKMLEKKGIPFRSITAKETGDEKIILVDAMGVLDQCYEISRVVVMGGSFITTVGGHNIYEPARLGIPVVYGPHMHKQQNLVDALQKHNVGKQVELTHLQETIEDYLTYPPDPAPYQHLKNEMEGATERTYNLIKTL